jgi:hypothetical protein
MRHIRGAPRRFEFSGFFRSHSPVLGRGANGRWSGVSAGLLLLTLARVQCWLYFLSLLARVFSFARGRGFGCGTGPVVGVNAGLLLLTLARVICWLNFLSLLARLFSFALGLLGGVPAVVKSQCWVVAAYVSASCMLAKFFITISHCPWRDFISLSNGDKETKQRKRLSTICIKCPQRADHCFWFPRSTVLARATGT